MKFAVRALTLVLAISGIAVGVTTQQAPVQAQAKVFSHQVVSSAMPIVPCALNPRDCDVRDIR